MQSQGRTNRSLFIPELMPASAQIVLVIAVSNLVFPEHKHLSPVGVDIQLGILHLTFRTHDKGEVKKEKKMTSCLDARKWQ